MATIFDIDQLRGMNITVKADGERVEEIRIVASSLADCTVLRTLAVEFARTKGRERAQRAVGQTLEID